MRGFAIFLVVVLFFAGVYFAFIFIVGKSMNSQPAADVSQQKSEWDLQSQKIQELKDRQEDLKRQREDRMRDLMRR